MVEVEMDIPELDIAVDVAEIGVMECGNVDPVAGARSEPPHLTRGYGPTPGACERKAISMALVDRALRWRNLGEDCIDVIARERAFVRAHFDDVRATGFLEPIELPLSAGPRTDPEAIHHLRREAGTARGAAG